MSMFSVGILYSAQEFLEFVRDNSDVVVSSLNSFETFVVASPSAILEISQRCEWIRLTTSGHLEVTEKGNQILSCKIPETALQIQIGHLIESYLPTWIPLLSRGRKEAQQYMPKDALQCFREAGLFESTADNIVNWWDQYSKVSRRIDRESKVDLGRQGEKLSIQYERQRTKREPVWQGFESNLSGYDLLSIKDENDQTALRIEVKTSNSRPETASFYLTRNEWEVAISSDSYIFHLWSLKPKPKLKILTVAELLPHVPLNQGEGIWEKASMMFSPFSSL